MNLSVSALAVMRGEKLVIDGLSFAARSGDVVLVTGPNGAGKTTLLRALAGLIAPLSGAIRLDGGDPERTIAEQCHFAGHANGVKPGLTVMENLSFWATYLGAAGGAGMDTKSHRPDARQRAEHALDRLALAALAHVPVRYLSAGQRRRAGLARLLVADRPIWLLDEPTASLDAGSAELVVAAIDGHTGNGGLAVVATHVALDAKGARELRLG